MVSNKICYPFVLSTVDIYLLNLLERLLETHTLREACRYQVLKGYWNSLEIYSLIGLILTLSM